VTLDARGESGGVDFEVVGARSVGLRFNLVQTAPFDQAPAAAAGGGVNGSIRGRVVGTDGRSIPYADIRLTLEGEPRRSLSIRAGADGAFAFRDLPAGAHRVFAVKTGYGTVVGTDPDARTILRPAFLTLRVELIDGVDIRLARWGTISGQVTDERGDPIQGVRVEVLQARYEGGQRCSRPAGASAISDDLGRYRFFDVAPGQYIVSATVGDVQSFDLPGYARALPRDDGAGGGAVRDRRSRPGSAGGPGPRSLDGARAHRDDH